jgi:hypothetical protein
MKVIGIPDKKNYGDLRSLRTDIPITLVRQEHNSHVAGRHTDLRMGTTGGMFSWALPKDLPQAPGEKKLAIPQPLHDWSYNDFEGVIGKGYGKGTVKRLEKSDVIILENSPTRLTFTRGDMRNPPVYTMFPTKNGNWLVMMRGEDIPLTIKTYSKEHFKSMPIEKIMDVMDEKAYATPKLDGAGALAAIGKHGVRVFGIRPDKEGNPIEYTDHIGGLRGIQTPKDLVGTTLRGEVVAERNGKVLPPQELSGFLNSILVKAAAKRIHDGTYLRMAPTAIVGPNGDDYDRRKVSEIVARLALPQFMDIPKYDRDAAMKAIEAMRKGKHPLTNEGLVIQREGQRPIKMKLTDDSDVVVRNIFPAMTKDGSRRAGGFEYSLPGSNSIVGRVGTGFDHRLLQDMLDNPNNYLGRTARIRHFGQYDSGAYRAPAFISMKED